MTRDRVVLLTGIPIGELLDDRSLSLREFPGGNLKPVMFDWCTEPEQATVGLTVCANQAIRTEINHPGRKIGWIAGNPADSGIASTVRWIRSHLEKVLSSYDLIVSSDLRFCQAHPRIIYHQPASSASTVPLGKQAIYRKTGMLAMIVQDEAGSSESVVTEPDQQQIQSEYSRRLARINRPVSFQADTFRQLARSRFRIVIEDFRVDGYYSSALTDCFATGTVPITSGAIIAQQMIGGVFDPAGVLQLDDVFDPSELSEALYQSLLPAIRRNFEALKNQPLSSDLLYRRYIRQARRPQLVDDQSTNHAEDLDRNTVPWSPWETDPWALPLSATAEKDSVRDSVIPEVDADVHLARVCSGGLQNVDQMNDIPEHQYLVSPIETVIESPGLLDPANGPKGLPIQLTDAFLVRLDDAYIGDNVIFDQLNFFRFDRWWAGHGIEIYRNTATMESIDAGVCITAWGGEAFQHFLIDAVAQLAAVIDWLETPEFCHVKIVSHWKGAAFARWFFTRLGLEGRVVQKATNAKEHHVVHANTAFFFHTTPNTNALGMYPRDCLRPIQKRLGLLDKKPRKLVIYIGRGKATRSVANEEAILQSLQPILAEQGLELHRFHSKADWDEDLALFSQAVIVFGPHGGAMANIVFSPPGTHVIEFIPFSQAGYTRPAQRNAAYYGLAQAAGHHYWALEPEQFDFDKPGMVIDAADILAIFHRILTLGDRRK